MSRLIRNVTTAHISLPDLLGAGIEPGEILNLDNFPDYTVRNSTSLIQYIAAGGLIYNDGTQDIVANNAIQTIRGLQNMVATTDNGKQVVITTSRPTNTFAYFTGVADDVPNNKVGQGTPLIFSVQPGQTQSIKLSFVELIYFIDGSITFQNAALGSYLDQGVWVPAGMPFPAPTNHGNYDVSATGALVPNATGTGAYYVLPTDTLVNTFINKYSIFGSGTIDIGTTDVARLYQGWYMELSIYNASTTDVLQAVINMHIFRMRTT